MSWKLSVLVCCIALSTDLLSAQIEFGPPNLIVAGIDGNKVFDAGDVDGDGDVDLLLSGSPGDDDVVWYSNLDGRGTFGFGGIVDRANGVFSVSFGDIDGDGDLDVAGGKGGLVWYENVDGLGTFLEHDLVGDSAPDVRLGDIDGDGDLDAVFRDLIWRENEDGLGTFGPGIRLDPNLDPEFDTGFFDLADMEGDGDLDVVSAGSTCVPSLTNLTWLINDGTGAFTAVVNDDLGPFSTFRDVRAADVDDDGDMDVVAATDTGFTNCDGEDGGIYRWFENAGDGTVGDETELPGCSPVVNFVEVADLDIDGDIDVLGGGSFCFTGNLVVNDNANGQGVFSGPFEVSTSQQEARNALARDLDGDGDLDVISTFTEGFFDSLIEWYENLLIPSGPGLALTGACPGPTTLDLTDFTPLGTAGFIVGVGPGADVVPSGPCAGTPLGIEIATFGGFIALDDTGAASLLRDTPEPACGLFIQAVDETTCGTSQIVRLAP